MALDHAKVSKSSIIAAEPLGTVCLPPKIKMAGTTVIQCYSCVATWTPPLQEGQAEQEEIIWRKKQLEKILHRIHKCAADCSFMYSTPHLSPKSVVPTESGTYKAAKFFKVLFLRKVLNYTDDQNCSNKKQTDAPVLSWIGSDCRGLYGPQFFMFHCCKMQPPAF